MTSASTRAAAAPFAEQRLGAALLGALGVLGALAIWQLVPAVGLVPEEDIPPASAVLGELVSQASGGAFWSAVGKTLAGAGLGLLIAVVAGVAIGTLMATNRVVWHALRPTVEFLRPVPGVALIPVAILVFGASMSSDVFLVAFGCVWPMIVQTIYGIRSLDDVARQTARAYRLTLADRLRFVTLPSAMPYIATGLRIASAIALVIAVTAEIVATNPGLGREIMLAQSAGLSEKMYAYIVAAGILGVLVHLVFSGLERRFLHWHQSQRGGQG
jgi:ABC-type nitrate/sulfonate/bicarbonate transport system permease component